MVEFEHGLHMSWLRRVIFCLVAVTFGLSMVTTAGSAPLGPLALAADPTIDDFDGDGLADAFDPDEDGDGVPDNLDNYPRDPSRPGTDPEPPPDADNDGDQLPDSHDPDDDNDGTPDFEDPDPLVPNEEPPPPAFPDFDSDGLADEQDPDDDNDGTTDQRDPEPHNPQVGGPPDDGDITDHDGDGVNDAFDPDDDNDGVTDFEDFAPLDPNVQVNPGAQSGHVGRGRSPSSDEVESSWDGAGIDNGSAIGVTSLPRAGAGSAAAVRHATWLALALLATGLAAALANPIARGTRIRLPAGSE